MMLTLLLVTAPAHAVNLKWWGAGPTLGTMLFPTQYPTSFPAAAKEGGVTSGDPLVEKVGGDAEIGVRGVIYPSNAMRLGAQATLGFGTAGFGQQEFVLSYESVLRRENDFQVVAGLGLGVGHERFNSEDGNGTLSVSYYPIRGDVAALLRDKTRAYELGAWGTYHIAGSQTYTDPKGNEIDGKGNSVVAGALYFGIGLEATVWFGDFKSDTKKKSNGKNNK